MVGSSTRTLSTAEERRETVMQAAVRAFAARGYYGTTTAEVAKAAGISQAYIYRLFPDKETLFVALIDHCARLMRERMADGAASVTSTDPAVVLEAMTSSYRGLVTDRSLLMVLLQANGAAAEPAIGEAIRACYAKQVEYVRAVSGASEEQVRAFFANATLMNILVAIDAATVDAPWSRTLSGGSRQG